MRKFATLIILIVVAGVIFGLGYFRRGADDKPILHVADDVPLTVSIAQPTRQEITQIVQAPGDVEAVLEVEVRSEIVAKIDEMPVKEGDIVKKGDLLCRLNDSNLRAEVQSGLARVARLKAAIVDAEAETEKADRDYRRQLQLTEVDATSDKERQDYSTTFKKSRALLEMRTQELAESEAYLTRLKEDLKKTVITAPIGGIISKLSVKEGEIVVTGTMNNPGTVIMTISDLSRMQVRARVDEVDVPMVKPGQKARIFLQADQQKSIPAQVVRVASKSTKVVGRDVVSFETILEVQSNDDRVRPGMTSNVEIEVAKQSDAVTIPVEAVVHRMRKDLPEDVVRKYDAIRNRDLSEQARQAQYIKVVYVKDNDVARVRLVDTGIADSRFVEMKNGIDPKETVITGPYRSLDQLKEGQKVALSKDDEKKLKEKKDEKHLAEGNDKSGENGAG
ncbi:MAG: efflux RND transporter periplasmic adaptor subunit [Planctomycetes bacterium]|nr:efflux RND transporter periplasmic adaptor subunit [Planctomycetota bacterium]